MIKNIKSSTGLRFRPFKVSVKLEIKIFEFIKHRSKINGSCGFSEIVRTLGQGKKDYVSNEVVNLQRRKYIVLSSKGGFIINEQRGVD